MLVAYGLLTRFWEKAISRACFVQNRSIVVKRRKKTPYELINQRKSNVKFFDVFGCRCFIPNVTDHLSRFDKKVDEGKFTLYSLTSKPNKVFNTKTNMVPEIINISFVKRHKRLMSTLVQDLI